MTLIVATVVGVVVLLALAVLAATALAAWLLGIPRKHRP